MTWANKKGSIPILFSLLLSVIVLASGYSLQRLAVAKLRNQVSSFNSEAGFYAGEYAAVSGFIVNSKKSGLKPGVQKLSVSNELVLGEGRSAGPLLSKVTADNFFYSFGFSADSTAKIHCGRVVMNDHAAKGKSAKTFQTCLVDRAPACSDGSDNNETATFGNGVPWSFPALLNAKIAERNLPIAPFIAGLPIQRSSGASGVGFRWTSDGNLNTATLETMCNILGYKSYVSSSCPDKERSGLYPNGKCNYHSPGDNNFQRFNGTASIKTPANPKYGQTWVATLTCRGKITCQ